MFKRSLASCVAVAALATAITTPANAYELTVDGDTCTAQFSVEELKPILDAIGIADVNTEPLKITRAEAKEQLKLYERAITKTQHRIKEAEKNLKDAEREYATAADKAFFRRIIKVNKIALSHHLLMKDVYSDCTNGKNHSQLSSDLEAALSSDDGKPNDAGIGLIVGGVILGVVGLIAAALPALAPILPAQIRDMLHI